jgi:hypothetical protein
MAMRQSPVNNNSYWGRILITIVLILVLARFIERFVTFELADIICVAVEKEEDGTRLIE